MTNREQSSPRSRTGALASEDDVLEAALNPHSRSPAPRTELHLSVTDGRGLEQLSDGL